MENGSRFAEFVQGVFSFGYEVSLEDRRVVLNLDMNFLVKKT